MPTKAQNTTIIPIQYRHNRSILTTITTASTFPYYPCIYTYMITHCSLQLVHRCRPHPTTTTTTTTTNTTTTTTTTTTNITNCSAPLPELRLVLLPSILWLLTTQAHETCFHSRNVVSLTRLSGPSNPWTSLCQHAIKPHSCESDQSA